MWIYITWGMFLPLLALVVYKIFKHSINIYKLNKYLTLEDVIIDQDNYTKLELNPIKVDYRIPRTQKPFFVFDCPNIRMGQKTRKYTGHTKSGIRLPLLNLSFQNREFHDIHEYKDWGVAKVTMTNKLTRIICPDDKPLRREVNHCDVEEIKFTDDDRTIHISTKRSAWPIRIQFNNHEEAIKYLNAYWTLLLSYKDNRSSTDLRRDKERNLTKLRVDELKDIFVEVYPDTSMQGYRKKDFIKLFLDNPCIDEDGFITKENGNEQKDKK